MAVKNLPQQKNFDDVRSFLVGIAYKIPHLHISSFLRRMFHLIGMLFMNTMTTNKNSNAPVSAFPWFEAPFKLYRDDSTLGLEKVLMKKNEIDINCVIGYASRFFFLS